MEACAILNEDSVDSVAHLLQVGIQLVDALCGLKMVKGAILHMHATYPVTAPCLFSYL